MLEVAQAGGKRLERDTIHCDGRGPERVERGLRTAIMVLGDDTFPYHLRLNLAERRFALLQEYYELHHQNRRLEAAKDDAKKAAFFSEFLRLHSLTPQSLAIDLGCRGAALTKRLTEFAHWVGVDLDRNAIELANANGIPCIATDVSVAIDFVDRAFDMVMMTEVLEHLPYPAITMQEVHRILKQGQSTGYFLGSVPLDYHAHRRFAVMRGHRLAVDPTHIHSFSFRELDRLLRHYFEQVEYRVPPHLTVVSGAGLEKKRVLRASFVT